MNPEIPNRNYRISIKALILDETRTKFLVVQEENGKWELPGGGIDWGESPEECLKREVMEEMGLTVTSMSKTPSYFFTGTLESNGLHFANVVYEATLDSLNFTPSDECLALQFVNPTEAQDLASFSSVQMLAEHFNPHNHA